MVTRGFNGGGVDQKAGSYAASRLALKLVNTHGLRRGLHSFAASRLSSHGLNTQ
ncbi:MAG TPA: hypothetical protein VK639_12300 [Terriglobales bacterium]|nr:hypothetical protein [Terriglobales bacterium]